VRIVAPVKVLDVRYYQMSYLQDFVTKTMNAYAAITPMCPLRPAMDLMLVTTPRICALTSIAVLALNLATM
jgi:hypothetical protein